MRLFKDENNHIITEGMLRDEFALLKLIDPDTYGYSFENYIQNCTDKNRTLKELKYKGI